MLPPGAYKVRFEAQGFRVVDVPSVSVVVTETATLDRKLEIGVATEEVTVQAETEAIQTASASIGSVIGGESITDLPLAARNYTNLLALSAGASALVTNAADLGKGTQTTSVGGSGGGANNYQMDGASVNNYSTQSMTEQGSFGSIGIPNPDSIQEFNIQTSQYDAAYGRFAGANVNVVTKTGGNTFHGSVFEFLRNTSLNAGDWFANRSGITNTRLDQHQYGASVGGPIKKDKLFFFASFQGTAQKNGLSREGLGQWDSMLLPLGDRGTCTGNNLSSCDSAAQAFIQKLGQNYAGRRGSFGAIPIAADGSNINPVAVRILQLKLANGGYYIPSPNGANTAPGIGCDASGHCVASVPSIYREYQGIGNFDYLLTSKQTLSGRYFVSVSPRELHLVQGSTVPGTDVNAEFNNHAATLKLTSVLSNTLVNEVRGSYQRAIIKNESSTPYTATSA